MKKLILGIVGAMCVYSITEQSQASVEMGGVIAESSAFYNSANPSSTDVEDQVLLTQDNMRFL